MGKQREGERWLLSRRALICGFGASIMFLVMIFIIACISDTNQALFLHAGVSVKACLAVCAYLCGLLSTWRSRQNRLLTALTGEAVLLVMIGVVAVSQGCRGGWQSVSLDVGIMLIGAFAGALSQRKTGRKRRGKR